MTGGEWKQARDEGGKLLLCVGVRRKNFESVVEKRIDKREEGR